MSDPNDLSGQIQQNAANPQSASADGVSATNNPMSELIAADKYLAARVATKKPPFGVVFGAIVSPGAQQ